VVGGGGRDPTVGDGEAVGPEWPTGWAGGAEIERRKPIEVGDAIAR
jgi:hypothetical protein